MFLPLVSFFSLVATAAPLPTHVTVWKYSGRSFYRPHFLDLIPDGEDSFLRTNSIDYSATLLNMATYDSHQLSPYSLRDFGSAGEVKLELQNHYQEEHDYNQSTQVVNQMRAEAKNLPIPSSTCNTMLSLHQAFPLEKMMERGFLTQEMQSGLMAGTLNLRPDQITFFEVVQTMKKKDMLAKFGKIPPGAFHNGKIGEYIDWNGKTVYYEGHWLDYIYTIDMTLEQRKKIELVPYYDVKQATVMLISGQTLGMTHELPLNHSLKNEVLSKIIDRTQFKMIWEVGRAANLPQEDLKWAIEPLILQIKSEIAQLGIDEKDAYIFAHSPDEAHSKHYRRKFHMKDFSGYDGNADEKVLYASFADFSIGFEATLDHEKVEVKNLKSSIDQFSKAVVQVGVPGTDISADLYYRDFTLPQASRRVMETFEDQKTYRQLSAVTFDGGKFRDQLATFFHLRELGYFAKVKNVVLPYRRNYEPLPFELHRNGYEVYYFSIEQAQKYLQEYPGAVFYDIRKSPAWSTPLLGT